MDRYEGGPGEEREEVLRAAVAAAERVRFGDGAGASVTELTWPGLERGTRALARVPEVTLCFARIEWGARRGELCDRPAGLGTSHPGVGRCRGHGGETSEGRREGAWVVAHAFARELQCTPWEALLRAVRIAAGRVAFIEAKLASATEDRQLEPPDNDVEVEAARTGDRGGTNLHHWVRQAEVWHDRLTRVSKLAIDAGVAERLVRQLELEAQLMLRAANMTLDELGMDDDQRQRALSALARNLLALEAAEVGTGAGVYDTIDGESEFESEGK